MERKKSCKKQDAKLLRRRLTEADYQRLMALENPKLHRFVADAIGLCEPDEVPEYLAICELAARND